MTRRLTLLAIFLIALGHAPAVAQVAGPIEVFAQMHTTQVQRGGVAHGSCAVENQSLDAVNVKIGAEISYSDGNTQTVLRAGQPTALAGGETTILTIFFPIPQEAALGTATFTCTAQTVGGGRPAVASDSDTFEVIP